MALGSDISGVTDLDPALGEVDGRLALAQAILRRLGTKRGTLPEDRSYGFDVREIIGTTMTPLQIEQRVLAQVTAEEEVERATCKVTRLGETVTIEIQVRDADGPFRLTVTADALTTELLLEGQPV